MIVHKDGLFFGFSSVSDMPSTPVLTRVEFEAYFVYREAEKAREALIPRMERAIKQGSSSREGESAYDVVRHNAKRLSLKRILIEDRKSLYGMGFDTALVLLRAGVGVRRRGWDGGDHLRLVEFKRWGPRLVWAGGCHGNPDPNEEGMEFSEVELQSDFLLADDWEVAA